MTPIITVKNVSKIFEEGAEKLTVIHDINLEIYSGEFFVLVGPSGSGKSTILRIMSGLEKSYTGEIRFGPGVTTHNISFVFQQFALLPWLTVKNNISLGLIARHDPKEEIEKKVRQELKVFDLEKFAHVHPKELSGGMRQRVGIARALVTDPKIIFMDEPFSELDSFTAQELREELLGVWAERRPTIVMVTHIIQEALELADRVAVMTSRPGRIEKIVKNTLPRPRQMRSEAFYKLEDELYKLISPSRR